MEGREREREGKQEEGNVADGDVWLVNWIELRW